MKNIEQEQTIIRQYLLGELDEEGRQQVEQRVITDRDYKEEVLLIEEELLEDYVAGTLRDRDRDLFLKNYLSAPLQRRKLKITQALNKYAAERPPLSAMTKRERNRLRGWVDTFRSRTWFVQLSWAVLVLLVLGGSYLAYQTWRWRSQLRELQAELERLNGPQSSVLEASASVLQARLAPLSLRESSSAAPLIIMPGTQVVQLQLAVPSGQYQSYRAILKDSKDNEVLSFDGVPVRAVGNAKLLVIQIPARIFRTEDYMLTTIGLNADGAFEGISDYYFRVLVRQ